MMVPTSFYGMNESGIVKVLSILCPLSFPGLLYSSVGSKLSTVARRLRGPTLGECSVTAQVGVMGVLRKGKY